MDCFKSNGTEITETRNASPFKVIDLNNQIDLTIYKGNEYKIEVTAGKHIIKNISTTIFHDTLKIENNNKCNFVRGYKKTVSVAITLPYVKYIGSNGVGTIRFADGYYQDSLEVHAESSGDIHVNGTFKLVSASSNGNGDLYLSGSTNTLSVFTNGTNYVYARDFSISDYANLETLTLGDCHINGTNLQRFDYKIHKSGKIYYRGTPAEINNQSEDKGKYAAIQEP